MLYTLCQHLGNPDALRAKKWSQFIYLCQMPLKCWETEHNGLKEPNSRATLNGKWLSLHFCNCDFCYCRPFFYYSFIGTTNISMVKKLNFLWHIGAIKVKEVTVHLSKIWTFTLKKNITGCKTEFKKL